MQKLVLDSRLFGWEAIGFLGEAVEEDRHALSGDTPPRWSHGERVRPSLDLPQPDPSEASWIETYEC